jgi:hypothetical protein
VILFSPLGVPFAAAAAEIQILRLMAMVVPVALFVAVAIDQLYAWTRRWAPYTPVAIGTALLFAAATARLTHVTLTEGPTWYRNYGLYGMQYGSTQVFAAIREELEKSPDTRILLSHTWANNPNEFLPFFLPPQDRRRVVYTDIRGHLVWKKPMADNEIFVVTAEELEEARKSQKLIFSAPERVIPYPDGRPGFVFIRARYVRGIDEIFAAEKAARKRLIEEPVGLGRETLTARHSVLDMGQIQAIFDGRADTLIRGMEANPFILELEFPRPRLLRRIRMDIGRIDNVIVGVEVTGGDGEPVRSESAYSHRPEKPRFELTLPEPVIAQRLRLDVRDLNAGEITHIHVFELELNP